MALWRESVEGVSNKLPTREGDLDVSQVVDNLCTAAGLVLARVGDVGLVPDVLVDLASKVVEFGAASLTEQQDFPEQSTNKDALGNVLWTTFMSMMQMLVDGVEAVGGEPNVETRPAFTFAPPWMIPYRAF